LELAAGIDADLKTLKDWGMQMLGMVGGMGGGGGSGGTAGGTGGASKAGGWYNYGYRG
jgi:hypothetical protein